MRTRLLAVLAIALSALAPSTSVLARPNVCLLAGPAAPTAAAGAPQSPDATILPQPGQAYTHISLGSNIICDSTYLDNPALNGQPGTLFFVTPSAFAYPVGVIAPHPPGIWYDSGAHQWAIYNDDVALMDQGRSWNVFIPPQDDSVAVHTSLGGNITGTETLLDDPLYNNDPSAVLFVQHNYNPGAPAVEGGVNNYYTRTVGVSYNPAAGRWAIRNEDGLPFPAGITFNVLWASPDETYFTHTVTAGNQATPGTTLLDHPALNGNRDAEVLITQNFGAGVANNHMVAAVYNAAAQRWAIVNVDGSPLPLGATFNVLVVPPKTGFLVHTATPGNTTLNATAIDNPDLNGDPDALVYVMHNWNPPESDNELSDNHPIGVQYLGGYWNVIHVDGAPMPAGLTFNVYYTLPRGNSFSVSASAQNSNAHSIVINSPALNEQPGAVPIATFNASPADLAGAVYTPTVGYEYDNGLEQWTLFNSASQSFVMTQTYNVLASPSDFVVTATTPIGDGFIVNSPLTNNNPWALVFATPRQSGGTINQKNVGVYYFQGRWRIYNEDGTLMTAGSVYDVFVTRFHTYLPLARR